MRTRALPLVLALALAAPALDASGATPVWTVTNAAEGGMSTVNGTRSGTVVAVVGGSTVLSSKDYGVTWSPLLTGPPSGGSSQTRVAPASAARWFAENGNAVSVTGNGGTTWQAISPPPVVKNPGERFEWADEVAAADGTTTALVGWGGARISGGCPYAFGFTPVFSTHNAGRSWTRANLPAPGMTWGADWYDAKRAVLVLTEFEWSEPVAEDDGSCGSEGTFAATSVWVTSDGGARWKRVLRNPSIWYASASFATPTTLVVIAETNGTGYSLVSPDAGRTFRKPMLVYTTTPAGDTKMNGFPALDFADGKRGWVNAILSGVFRTDNAGSEWTHEVSPSDGAFYGVPDFAALNRDRAVVAGPWAIGTRQGDAPAAPFAGPVVPAPRDIVSTVVEGAFRREVTIPSYGPLSVRLLGTR